MPPGVGRSTASSNLHFIVPVTKCCILKQTYLATAISTENANYNVGTLLLLSHPKGCAIHLIHVDSNLLLDIVTSAFLVIYCVMAAVLLDEFYVLWGYWRKNPADLNHNTKIGNEYVTFLIAAHNEARVIAGLLNSIHQLNYPEDRILVWSVADRCSDQTATVASELGADVFVRHDKNERGEVRLVGKGYALNELLDIHCHQRDQSDVFIILDADVRLTPEYLQAMLQVYRSGYPVVQGSSLTQSPDESALANVSSYAARLQHVVQVARYRLKLPNLIIGNSLLIDRETMRKLNWQVARASPTEEEIKIPLIAWETPIGYAADAVVYEEPVHDIAALANQRSRWFRDYVVFLFSSGLPLLFKSVLTLRWKRAEAAFAHFVLTSQTLETLAFGTVAAISIFMPRSFAIIAIILLSLKLLHVGLLCIASRMHLYDLQRFLVRYPQFVLGWLGGIALWLKRPARSGWNHTKHRGDENKA